MDGWVTRTITPCQIDDPEAFQSDQSLGSALAELKVLRANLSL